MNRVTLKPRRRIRHEILSLVPLAVLIAVLFLMFPFSSIALKGLTDSVPSGIGTTCVLVELTADEEARAMEIIRSAFSTDAGSVRDLRADLSLSTIPEQAPSLVMDFDDRKRPRELTEPSLEIFLIPRSLAAPEPGVIQAAEPPAARPAFSKEELLKPID